MLFIVYLLRHFCDCLYSQLLAIMRTTWFIFLQIAISIELVCTGSLHFVTKLAKILEMNKELGTTSAFI